ncbi:MAG: MBL fold metallo-hydrolase [Bacteroidetes bacterium]|nr:MBL fold metallo-hydrolase [Bacteroidota bacterium]
MSSVITIRKYCMAALLVCASLLLHAQKTAMQVVGIMQDGGSPQLGCLKPCCKNNKQREFVSSIALIDSTNQVFHLLDATPDIASQFQLIYQTLPATYKLGSIFLTHAHIGHYTGLQFLGREAMNAAEVPVYVMPRMGAYLTKNGPWSQLVQLKNIQLQPLVQDQTVQLGGFQLTPLLVPHRDEFSETVGFRVKGAGKSLLFIPDIDKWEKWDRQLIAEIEKVDYAFIDGTFFADGEINRPMHEIPHPFISETIRLLDTLPRSIRERVYFTHFNHTNPLLQHTHPDRIRLEKDGYHFATTGTILSL